MTPAPPSPFPAFNTTPLKSGLRLYRFHDPAFEGAAYNPCLGGPTRFAPLASPTGECLPTLYAAATLEAAAWESIFHDAPYVRGPKSVRLNKVKSRALSVIELVQDLTVAPLHGPDLLRLGLRKTDLIETAPMAYRDTARWAEAFHRAHPKVAGLRWTSIRGDPGVAFVFFEDRAPSTVWKVVERIDIATAPGLLEDIRQIARRADITLTL
jgi:hypothetical protein